MVRDREYHHRTIQNRFPHAVVSARLHDDITIVAKKRTDFDLLIEAALFMGPLLEEQGSRMNMRKSRFIYYGASAMAEETQEAIKKAGLTFVTMQGLNHLRRGAQTALHTWSAGRPKQRRDCRDGTAGRKGENTEFGENHDRCCQFKMQWWYVLRKAAFANMNYITRCCTPAEARRATEHFDEEVLKYLCEINSTSPKE
jgi:hypothetical protein